MMNAFLSIHAKGQSLSGMEATKRLRALLIPIKNKIYAQSPMEWNHYTSLICLSDPNPIGVLNTTFYSYSFDRESCFWTSGQVLTYYKADSFYIKTQGDNPKVDALNSNSQFYGYSFRDFKDNNKKWIEELATQLIVHKLWYGSFQHVAQEQSKEFYYDHDPKELGRECRDISDHFEINPDTSSDIESISICLTLQPVGQPIRR